MRISAICSIVLSLSLCVFFAGCGGDTGDSVGKDAKALGEKIAGEAGLKVEDMKDPAKMLEKIDKIKTASEKYKKEGDAIQARYGKLSAEEKKKAEALWPALKK